MKIIEGLKRTDRTLLEMYLGQLLFGIVCQLAGFFLAKEQGRYAASLWLGVLFALVAGKHMADTLDRALQQGENAAKIVTRGYIFRYAAILLVLVIAALTEALNPLVVFLGYMSLKVTAYLQPLTHKLLLKVFHE